MKTKVMKTKLCLRCGGSATVFNEFDTEYYCCEKCGMEWQWDGESITVWWYDDEGGETLMEVPRGCLFVVGEET
jgi:ribosomal protein S27AE